MDVNEKLAPNFTFGELTRTRFTSLLPTNRQEALAFIEAGRALATMLQVVRDHFKRPVTVHSGFRGQTLNAKVGGSKTSQHMRFEAVDFSIEGVPLQQIFDWIRNESGLAYGQVILEGNVPGKPTWIHLSLGEPWRKSGNRRAMVFDGKTYSPAKD